VHAQLLERGTGGSPLELRRCCPRDRLYLARECCQAIRARERLTRLPDEERRVTKGTADGRGDSAHLGRGRKPSRACQGLERLEPQALRYTRACVGQLTRSLTCNALHPVEKRLCRWLLAVQGRTESTRFPMTHEFLASMLGVRRASVTDAARRLRQAGLIRYGQGQLTVLDRAGLESAACACHRLIEAEFDDLSG